LLLHGRRRAGAGREEQVARNVVQEAAQRDVAAVREVLGRIDG
jgi:hypothetical protein